MNPLGRVRSAHVSEDVVPLIPHHGPVQGTRSYVIRAGAGGGLDIVLEITSVGVALGLDGLGESTPVLLVSWRYPGERFTRVIVPWSQVTAVQLETLGDRPRA